MKRAAPLSEPGGSALIVKPVHPSLPTRPVARVPVLARAQARSAAKMLSKNFIACVEALGVPVQTRCVRADMFRGPDR